MAARPSAEPYKASGMHLGWTAVYRLSWLLMLVVVAGCGDRLASVSGSVTLDGQPLAGGPELSGIVQFVPEGGGGTPAIGYLDANGHYQLASGSRLGIRPGKYLVSISAAKIIPPAQPGEAAGGRPATPRLYADPRRSGLTAEVRSGSNTFDFAILSQPEI